MSPTPRCSHGARPCRGAGAGVAAAASSPAAATLRCCRAPATSRCVRSPCFSRHQFFSPDSRYYAFGETELVASRFDFWIRILHRMESRSRPAFDSVKTKVAQESKCPCRWEIPRTGRSMPDSVANTPPPSHRPPCSVHPTGLCCPLPPLHSHSYRSVRDGSYQRRPERGR